MRRVLLPAITIAIGLLAALGVRAIFVQDKYTVQVPDGLAFSEFRGDEGVRVPHDRVGKRLRLHGLS